MYKYELQYYLYSGVLRNVRILYVAIIFLGKMYVYTCYLN